MADTPGYVSNSQLAEKLSGVIDRWDTRENQMVALLTQPEGTVTVTDGVGQNHVLPSYPEVLAGVSGATDVLTGAVAVAEGHANTALQHRNAAASAAAEASAAGTLAGEAAIGALSAPGGSSLIGFSQAGGGSTLSALSKARERVSALDYGAVGDGAADDTVAIQKLVNEAIGRGKLTARLGAGRYRITSKITGDLLGLNGFSLEGEGMGVTEILVDYAEGNGIELVAAEGNYWLDVGQHAAIRLANFTLVSNRISVGTAVLINGGSVVGRPPQAIVFDHVEFRGASSFEHAFNTCVDLLDAASVQFIGCRWVCGGPGFNTSMGVELRASGSTTAPTEFKFTDCEWYFCAVAVSAGNYVEGVYFSNPTMVNCTKGIRYVTTSGESGLVVNGGHFNCYERNIEVQNVFDITISGPIMFNAAGSAGFRHISLDSCGAFTVQGHVLRGSSTDIGVYVNNVPVGWAGTIGPGHYSGLGAGAYLDSGSRNVTVSNGSSYAGMTDRVVNAGTGNDVQLKAYTIGVVVALTGGAPSEGFNVAIPTGMFVGKPTCGSVQVSGAFNLSATFDQADGATTAVNARCVAMKPDWTPIGAGAYQFNVTLFGE